MSTQLPIENESLLYLPDFNACIATLRAGIYHYECQYHLHEGWFGNGKPYDTDFGWED